MTAQSMRKKIADIYFCWAWCGEVAAICKSQQECPALLNQSKERDYKFADQIIALDEPSEGELQAQIDKLANFIMDEVLGEPSQSEGAVDCAIRIIRQALHDRQLYRKDLISEDDIAELNPYATIDESVPPDRADIVMGKGIGWQEGFKAGLLHPKQIHQKELISEEEMAKVVFGDSKVKIGSQIVSYRQIAREQATLDQLNFDKERKEFWEKIADLTRKGEQLCQQNGELLIREHDLKKELAEARKSVIETMISRGKAGMDALPKICRHVFGLVTGKE